jgi:DNA-binding beta-propeller fold protein YncE
MTYSLFRRKISGAFLASAISILSILTAGEADAQINPPKFEVDPSWPKPFPHRWVTGDVGGTCVDSQDHVFVISRSNLEAKEKKIALLAPPVIELDRDGGVVNSWGDRKTMPDRLHGCFVDSQDNVWITGTEDGFIQKYSHDGSKLLLQIGTKGILDTSDGTPSGNAMNSSHTSLNGPSGLAVDSANGDIYIADGLGNKRVVVFDREGHFLRQWGQQATKAQVDAGIGGGFLKVLHCLVLGNDGLVYVCDREADRIEVFDKMGKFVKNIRIESKYPSEPGAEGSASCIAFSPDQGQKFMYAVDTRDEEIRVLDHATGQTISTFGQPGQQVGEFYFAHSVSVNSKGDLIIGQSLGRRVQMFRLVDKSR